MKNDTIPATTPRKPWTFNDDVNSDIRRAAETGIYDIRGAGMILTVSVTLISLANVLTGSSNNEIRSTKPAGQAIAQYIRQGFKPFSLGYADFGVFFQYHARHRLPEYRDWNALIREFEHHDRVVIISTTRAWELWPDRPPEARIVHTSPKNPSLSKNYDWMNNEPAVFVLEKNLSGQ